MPNTTAGTTAGTTPRHTLSEPLVADQWHDHIRSAPSFGDAQDRMEEAVRAGVNFADLLALQSPGGLR